MTTDKIVKSMQASSCEDQACSTVATPAQTGLRLLLRVVTTTVGFTLIFAAIMWSFGFGFSSTGEGIIAGDLITQTAPISGTIVRFSVRPGDWVEAEQILAVIRNERVDISRLEDLRGQKIALHNRLQAIQRQIATRGDDRIRQQQDLAKQLTFEERDLDRRIEEAKGLLEVNEAVQRQRQAEYQTMAALFEDRLGSRLDFERARDAWLASGQMGVALILDIDSQAARTGLRSGRRGSSIAGPHRSLRARARSCTMC